MIDTLVQRTHLWRSTVIKSLDSLKGKGFINWASGGRKKGGRALSNMYELTLPKKESIKDVLNVEADVDKSDDGDESTVHEMDWYPSTRETMQGPPDGLCRVHVVDPIISNKTSIYHPDGHNPPPEAAGEMPGRFVTAISKSGGAIFKSGSAKIKSGADTMLRPHKHKFGIMCA